VTTLFGKPGLESVRGKEFREALGDVRTIIETFAPEFCPPGVLSLQGIVPEQTASP